MKENTLVSFGESAELGCGLKFSIYFKNCPIGRKKHGAEVGAPKRQKRYFLRQTAAGSDKSTEIRITSAQVAECRDLPGEGMDLVRGRIQWAVNAISAGKRPRTIVFEARALHAPKMQESAIGVAN